jgi:DNA-binding NtrC family response regulator
MQVKLLRALQEGEIDPIGSKRPSKVDVRIISATNRNLAELTRDSQFREDLYYRLNVFPIFVPPLRERRADVPALARHFITRFAAEEHKAVVGLTPEALDIIEGFDWPGNVRQLENTIFRAVVLCDGNTLDVCDFPQIAAAMGVDARIRKPVMAAAPEPVIHTAGVIVQPLATLSSYAIPATDVNGNMRRLEDVESEMIRMAISHYDGHMSEVARRLGIGRSTLYRKLKDLGLDAQLPPEAHEEPRRAAS